MRNVQIIRPLFAKKSLRLRPACALIVAAIPLMQNAIAQTVNWSNPAGGAYSVGTNWSNAIGVGAGSSSLFGLAGSYTITFLSSASAVNSNINTGTVNFLGGPSRSYILSGGLALNNGTLNVSSLNIAATGPFTVNNSIFNVNLSSILSSSTLSLGTQNAQSATLNLSGGTTTAYRASSGTGTSVIGGNGGTGLLKISTDSVATFDSHLTIGDGNSVNSNGQILMASSVDPRLVLNNNLYIAPGSGLGAGTLNVIEGSVTQTGARSVTVGGTGSGSAKLLVDFAGAFSGGTGLMQINPSGQVYNAGTFFTGGNVLVNGGRFDQTQSYYGQPTAGTIAGTLTVSNGGTATLSGGTLSVHSLDLNGGWLDWTDTPVQDRTLIINGGSILNDSFFTVGETTNTVSGRKATIKFINGATHSGAISFISTTEGELQVLSGSNVSLSQVAAQAYGSNGPGYHVLVSGSNSVLTTDLLDSRVGGSAVVTVQSGGLMEVNANALLVDPFQINIKSGGTFSFGDAASVYNNHVINVAGGTLSILNTAVFDPEASGSVNFTAGTLRVRSSTNVDADFATFALGAPSILSFGKGLQIDGTGTFNVPVQLSGGTLTLTGISGGTNLNLVSGTLNLNNPTTFTIGSSGPLGSNIILPPAMTMNVSGNTSANTIALLSVNGGVFNGVGSYTNNGEILMANGGRFTSGTLTNNGNGTISGNGRLITKLTNNGLIRVGPTDFLRFQGTSNANGGTVNLLGGVVEFTNGLTNNTTGTILGRGSVLVPGTLTNTGTITLTGGAAEVQGRVTNTSTSRTTVTGGANASFYDTVTNDPGSVFKVSDASIAAFLGDVQGLAAFTGAGTIIFEGSTTPGPLAATGTAIVQSTANVSAQHIRDNALIVRGPTMIVPDGTSAGTSRLKTLSIEASAFDLTDNDLILDHDGVSPITTIRSNLQSHALFSSLADASVSPKFALGYMENTAGLTTFSGQAIDSTALLIAYTVAGDSNLDGKVNTIDFNQLAGSFGQSNRFWMDGDYDYNGIVNSIDFNLLLSNYGQTMPGSGSTLGTVVPEPSTFGLLISVLLVKRRRAVAVLK